LGVVEKRYKIPYYLLRFDRIIGKQFRMKLNPNKPFDGESTINLVYLYFARLIERQRLETEYYNTSNTSLLPEIEKARERIREVMSEMGIKIKQIEVG
jgi:hypothetical protein